MGTYVHVSMSKCSGDGNPHRRQKLQLCWGSNFGLQIKDPDGRPFETGKKNKRKLLRRTPQISHEVQEITTKQSHLGSTHVEALQP